MNIIAIFSGIVSIAQAIPKIKSMIDMFVDFYIDWEIEKIETNYNTKRKKQEVLIKQIQKATNDEERKVLSVILSDYSKL